MKNARKIAIRILRENRKELKSIYAFEFNLYKLINGTMRKKEFFNILYLNDLRFLVREIKKKKPT